MAQSNSQHSSVEANYLENSTKEQLLLLLTNYYKHNSCQILTSTQPHLIHSHVISISTKMDSDRLIT